MPSGQINSTFGSVTPDILIVRLSAMGDVLLTTPLLRAIRLAHPGASLTFVTRARQVPLLEHNPRITRLVGWDPPEGMDALVERLDPTNLRGFTHRLDLQRTLRSRRIRRKLGGIWTTYPKYRMARTLLIRTKRNWYRDRRPVAERYFDAARELGVQPDGGSLEMFVPRAATDVAERFCTSLIHQVVAIAPGASQATKRWPLHHWIALARLLTDQGNDVAVLGGAMDGEVADQIVAATEDGSKGSVRSAAGFDLPTTAAILRKCRALVTGDTGQMHLATAMGTPVVALFGPTVEAFGFFPYQAKSAVVQLDLACRPCSSQGSAACPLRHHRCLQDLQPDLVMQALRKLPR